MSFARKVYVIGCGMTKFEKPGSTKFCYPDMVKEAVTKAIKDAKIDYKEIKQAVCGYVFGDSTSGQRGLYGVGVTGIPIYNVNNNCATGSSALYLGKQIIESGNADCVLACGFEKMERGSLNSKYEDRSNPLDRHIEAMSKIYELTFTPRAAQFFGNAGLEYIKRFPHSNPDHFAMIAYKNHKHSVNNPYSQFQDEYTLEDIKKSKKVHGFLTMLQCCPTSDGSGACILANEEFVKSHNLEAQAVEIAGMEMATDMESTFKSGDMLRIIGYDMTKTASERLFRKSGLSPKEINVIELHDCFSTNELINYEALGICGEGEAPKLIDNGDNTYGGKFVVNPSGGLISKGHPLGATGLAQCSELCWQVRGLADKRQVPGAKLGLQHNLGLGGAVIVALYRLGFPEIAAAQQAAQ